MVDLEFLLQGALLTGDRPTSHTTNYFELSKEWEWAVENHMPEIYLKMRELETSMRLVSGSGAAVPYDSPAMHGLAKSLSFIEPNELRTHVGKLKSQSHKLWQVWLAADTE